MTFKVILAALLLFLLTNEKRCVKAALVQRGKCPTKAPMDIFNLEKFSGRWYSVKISKPRSLPRECLQILVSLGEDGSVDMHGASYFPRTSTIQADRQISLPRTDPAGRYKFLMDLGDGRTTLLDLRILDSDYLNYAVIYSCAQVTPFFVDRIMVLSRTTELPEEFHNRVNQVLQDNYLPSLNNLASIFQYCGEYSCSSTDKCSYSLRSDEYVLTTSAFV